MSEFGSETSRRTVRHYAGRAEAFWEGTRDHDVTRIGRRSFVTYMETGHTIFDFGCGPGRDVRAFSKAGYEVTGLDGCATFCDMARDYSGCHILHQDFLALDLRKESFDGIFANASIFHVPTEHLARVLVQLHTALKPHGVLFCSNPQTTRRMERRTVQRISLFRVMEAPTGRGGLRLFGTLLSAFGLPERAATMARSLAKSLWSGNKGWRARMKVY